MRVLILDHTAEGPRIYERQSLEDLCGLLFSFFINGAKSHDGCETVWVCKRGKWSQPWPYTRKWGAA